MCACGLWGLCSRPRYKYVKDYAFHVLYSSVQLPFISFLLDTISASALEHDTESNMLHPDIWLSCGFAFLRVSIIADTEITHQLSPFLGLMTVPHAHI